jgi:hypothetical protein
VLRVMVEGEAAAEVGGLARRLAGLIEQAAAA